MANQHSCACCHSMENRDHSHNHEHGESDLLGAVGIATLWSAVFADVGVALLAILNATRVLKVH